MTSRTWRIHRYGGPEALVLDTLPVPEPGPGEVRVRPRAVGLNRSDLLWITAGFFKPTLPSRVGAEICGIVDAVGEGVTEFKPGDRVSNLPHPLTYAHFAEHTVLKAGALVHTPAGLSDAEGASFMFTHLTQVLGMIETGGLRPGMTVLVTAGTSANGNSAILLARQMGARVIATSRTGKAREHLMKLGADLVVATGEEGLAERVADFTGGAGVDIVYDCVGGEISEQLLLSLKMGGTWVMYGFLDPSPVTMSWPLWFHRQPTLKIFSVTQYSGETMLGIIGKPEIYRQAIRSVIALVESGKLAVPIGTVFSGIESVQAAMAAMDANSGGGKIVVTF